MFSGISWLLSWLLPRRKDSPADEIIPPRWEPWITTGNTSIERIWAGEIMFGSAYYQLRTLPAYPMIATPYFGDFHYECFGGVLLQRWNTTVPRELPDFDLLFFNGETRQLHHLRTIKAFSWKAEKTPDGVLLKWEESEQPGELLLTEQQVLHEARPLD